MGDSKVGVVIQGGEPSAAVDLIVEAEKLGIAAAWMTTGGIQADALTLFAAAAVRTSSIVMGSAIIPTWPRNPVFIAQQVLALEGLAPGRIRLGLGPSTEAAMRPFGVPFRTPLRQLREYLTILRALLHEGSVDFKGKIVSARARIARPPGTPVMASALQEGSYELCGEISDGAISWVTPQAYLRNRALPAMERGARKAGRERPPIIMHTPLCITEDPNAAREAAQRGIGMYARFQFYQDMFREAGFPEAGEGLSQALVDDLVVYGTVESAAMRLKALAANGLGEVMAMPLTIGEDRQASIRQCYEAVALAAR